MALNDWLSVRKIVIVFCEYNYDNHRKLEEKSSVRSLHATIEDGDGRSSVHKSYN